ncbi:MAG: DUF4912 domain-containing protein [Deltaproteobacteria bacterium]|nr:DUF4912 domain-containing protein [Deltaproteobacteria bacterium]
MAKSPKEYSRLLKGELLDLAKKAGLPDLGSLTKDEIVARLTKAGRAIEEKIAGSIRGRRKPAKATDAPARPEAAGPKPATAQPAAKAAAPAKPTKATQTRKPKAAVATGGSGTVAATRTAMATTTGTSSTTTTTATESDSASGSVSASESTSVPAAGDLDAGLPELPEGYADNRIVLLPRDPQWLYSYWDVTNEHKQAARIRGGLFLCLRLYDVTDVIFDGSNAHAMWEQEVHELARNWYLHVPSPGRRYCLEIGYRGGEGQWLPLARSNTVPAPVDRPAERIQDEFVTIPLDRPLAGAGGTPGAAAPGVAGLHDLLLPPGGAAGLAAATSAGLGGPWSGAWSGAAGAWSAAWSGAASVQPGPAKPRAFWLRADAELIVYGATEPDAEVLCGGRKLELAPDGTFFIRLHFPDGVHDFPIEATAVDREQQRRIRLTFHRRTE